jgi:hypothetical protein
MIGMQVMRTKASLDRICEFLEEEELEKYRLVDPTSTSSPTQQTVSESTPLLINEIADDEADALEALPEAFVPPTIGFYKAEFIYYGSDNVATSKKPEKKTERKSSCWPWKKSTTPSAIPPSLTESPVTTQTAFCLRNITVEFPLHLLSLVIGPTGNNIFIFIFFIDAIMACRIREDVSHFISFG